MRFLLRFGCGEIVGERGELKGKLGFFLGEPLEL